MVPPGGIDDKINPPAADHYSISGVSSENQKDPIFSVGYRIFETLGLCPSGGIAIPRFYIDSNGGVGRVSIAHAIYF